MKNLIMFYVLIMVMVFSSYEISYSQEENGLFLFLVGTEGNERAIMYLHILGTNAYGSYYTESQSIMRKFTEIGFSGSFDGRDLKLGYGGEWDSGIKINQKYITGTLSGDIVFRGKHNSKNINLSLANTPVNSARIYKDTDDYSSGKKFTFNVRTLNNLDYLGRLGEIAYLDDNIIIFNSEEMGGKWIKFCSYAYSINTGKEIEMKDFISNLNDRNLLALLRKKVLEYASNINDDYNEYNYNDETYYNFDFYDFLITPKDIIFYISYGHANFEGYEIYINFTFEELKPFIKRGSPLDYLFN